ncbi:MAG: ATP-binding protein [Pseudomonadota bacterium]
MKIFQFHSYFWRTLAIIGGISTSFLLIILSTLAYYMVIPLGHRATDDLASVITHAAETWDHLEPPQRKLFTEKMQRKHQLLLTTTDKPLTKLTNLLPYFSFLERSLSKQVGQKIHLKESIEKDQQQWFWADIPITNGTLRFGFPHARIGVNPPIAFFVLLIVGLFLIFFTAIILTYRLTVPIEHLYLAAQSVGKGHWPKPIEEKGAEELVVLVRGFNKMSIQVKELLSNRTTLLAGIAHDLRTPLTQIQLALSMLPNDGGDTELMESIRQDLDNINHLISETLSISLDLEAQHAAPVDINKELDSIIQNIQKENVLIIWSPGKPCIRTLQALALRRIINNLLENAIRYGAGKPIVVNCQCNAKGTTIQIIDKGEGIPAEKIEAVFRPFYRLEPSRGSSTGGSGLGLAIIKQLVDANGWKIQLQAHSEGGTIAILTITKAFPNSL